jgi:hypothetical protein
MSIINLKSTEYKNLLELMTFENKGFRTMNNYLINNSLTQLKSFEIKSEMRVVFSKNLIQNITKRYLIGEYSECIYRVAQSKAINLRTLKKIGFAMGMESPLKIKRFDNMIYLDGHYIESEQLEAKLEVEFWFKQFQKISPNYIR